MRHLLAVITVTACSAQPEPSPDAPVSEPFASERGFVELDGRHVFYVLFSADADPAAKPVFAIWNGGPGYPTTLGLLGDTAPMRAVDGGVGPNDASFTALGSVLYIDQPGTGFSYDPTPVGFAMQDDAAMFARAIVGVLDAHPTIQRSDVVVMGESYGGTRAQLVLDLMARETLPAIQAHVAAAGRRGAEQFAAQVLIQPVVMGSAQLHTGQGGCFDTRDPACGDLGPVVDAIANPVTGTQLLGGRLEDVAGLAGPDRHGVRADGLGIVPPTIDQVLVTRLGPHGERDAYYAGGPSSTEWLGDTTAPAAFLANLGHVRTLITRAPYDGVVDSMGIQPALIAAGYGATFDETAPAGAARPGQLVVTGASGTATIRMPSYEAGHMVTRSAARELRDDVAAWLAR